MINQKRVYMTFMLTGFALGCAQIVACSVDGVTPDCTNAEVCAPSLDSGSEASPFSEAAASEAAAPDASRDAVSAQDADANADAD